MDRRKFIKVAAGTAAAAGVTTASHAAENDPPIPGSLGMLFDSTLCVGCQACVAKCQQLNNRINEKTCAKVDGKIDETTCERMFNPNGEQHWSNNDKLSPFTRNIIQVWSSPNKDEKGDVIKGHEGDGKNNPNVYEFGKQKDQLENGYAYIKKQCMHCITPNCVYVCPTTALTKHKKTGIIHWHADVCIGCRSCMLACPYDVPQYDYNNPFGKLSKCELCNQHGLERLDKGGLPGCVEVCPAGAIIFGTREELLKEAQKRLKLTPGQTYDYPRLRVNGDDTYSHPVAKYQQKIYGEKEGGGTQVLVLSAIPTENFGLPNLEEMATGKRTSHLQHTMYKKMIAPAVLFAGITACVLRNQSKARKEEQEHGGHHE